MHVTSDSFLRGMPLPTQMTTSPSWHIPQPITSHINPLHAVESALLEKLQNIGMLYPDGSLAFYPTVLSPLNDSQLKRLEAIANVPISLAGTETPFPFSFYQHSHQEMLHKLRIDPKEYYLCKEAAAYVLGVDYFYEIVQEYLIAKSLPTDYCDAEFAALEAKNRELPRTIEVFDFIDTRASYSEAVNFYYSKWARDQYPSEPSIKRTIGSELSSCLFTCEMLLLPLKFFLHNRHVHSVESIVLYPHWIHNFYQAIVDSALHLLRMQSLESPLEHSLACGALLLSKSHFFPSLNPLKKFNAILQAQHLELFQKTFKEKKGNAIAYAFNLTPYFPFSNHQKLWRDLIPASEGLNSFFIEIYRLIVKVHLPFQTVSALLLFAGWTRSCFPSDEWHEKTGFSISLRKERQRSFFVYSLEGATLSVPIKFHSALKSLKNLEETQLKELLPLWNLIAPRPNEMKTPKKDLIELFGHQSQFFIYFKNIYSHLLSHSSPILNRMGFICLLANQEFVGRSSGLQIAFSKLLTLLPEEPHLLKEELAVLSSFLTPQVLFSPSDVERNSLFLSFINHLAKNRQRFYANVLLSHFLPQLSPERQSDSLRFLLNHLLGSDKAFALRLFKSYLTFLDPQFQLSFIEQLLITDDSMTAELLLTLLTLFASSSFQKEKKDLFTTLLEKSLEKELFEEARYALEHYGLFDFSHSNWQKLCSKLCSTLLYHPRYGTVEALSTWQRLTRIQQFDPPEVSFDLKTSHEQPFIPTTLVRELPPYQKIRALQNHWCLELDKIERKELQTNALLELILTRDPQIEILLSSYHFDEEQCDLQKFFTAILNYFNTQAPKGKEIQTFQSQLNLVQTKTLKPFEIPCLFSLIEQWQSLPCSKAPGITLKDSLCLALIGQIIQAACIKQNHDLAIRLVSFLETIYSNKEIFSKKLIALFKPYERDLFALLLAGDCVRETLQLLKLIEVYKIPRSSSCVKEGLLYPLFQRILEQEDHLKEKVASYSRLAFVLKTKRLMPTKKTLRLLLNYLDVFYLSANQPFKERCIVQIAHVFKKEPSLQPHLAKWLFLAAENFENIPLVLEVMEATSCWDQQLIEHFLEHYVYHEKTFQALKRGHFAGTFELKKKTKQAIFEKIFFLLLETTSKHIFVWARDPLLDFLPKSSQGSLKKSYFIKALSFIESPSKQIKDLKSLVDLHKQLTDLEIENDYLFFCQLIESKDTTLHQAASELVISLLSNPKNSNDPTDFFKTLEKLIQGLLERSNLFIFLEALTEIAPHLKKIVKKQLLSFLTHLYQQDTGQVFENISEEAKLAAFLKHALEGPYSSKTFPLLAYCYLTASLLKEHVSITNPQSIARQFSFWAQAFDIARQVNTKEIVSHSLDQLADYVWLTRDRGPNLLSLPPSLENHFQLMTKEAVKNLVYLIEDETLFKSKIATVFSAIDCLAFTKLGNTTCTSLRKLIEHMASRAKKSSSDTSFQLDKVTLQALGISSGNDFLQLAMEIQKNTNSEKSLRTQQLWLQLIIELLNVPPSTNVFEALGVAFSKFSSIHKEVRNIFDQSFEKFFYYIISSEENFSNHLIHFLDICGLLEKLFSVRNFPYFLVAQALFVHSTGKRSYLESSTQIFLAIDKILSCLEEIEPEALYTYYLFLEKVHPLLFINRSKLLSHYKKFFQKLASSSDTSSYFIKKIAMHLSSQVFSEDISSYQLLFIYFFNDCLIPILNNRESDFMGISSIANALMVQLVRKGLFDNNNKLFFEYIENLIHNNTVLPIGLIIDILKELARQLDELGSEVAHQLARNVEKLIETQKTSTA